MGLDRKRKMAWILVGFDLLPKMELILVVAKQGTADVTGAIANLFLQQTQIVLSAASYYPGSFPEDYLVSVLVLGKINL